MNFWCVAAVYKWGDLLGYTKIFFYHYNCPRCVRVGGGGGGGGGVCVCMCVCVCVGGGNVCQQVKATEKWLTKHTQKFGYKREG